MKLIKPKSNYIFLVAFFFSMNVQSQDTFSSTNLETQNRKLLIDEFGSIEKSFKYDMDEEKYKTSDMSQLWMGGWNDDGELKMSLQYKFSLDQEFGPLNEVSGLEFESAEQYFHRVWIIYKHQIDRIKYEFNSGTLNASEIPKDILE